MLKEPIVLLEQRDFGRKINATFEFATRNFGPLSRSLLSIAGPFAVFAGITTGLFKYRFLRNAGGQSAADSVAQYLSVEYVLSVLLMCISIFLVGAVVSGYMTLYERRQSEEPISVDEVWREISGHLLSLAIGQLMIMVLVIVGFIFLVIPGIYLCIPLSFFTMIVVRNHLSPVDACKYSLRLIKDEWWATFGLLMVISFIQGVLGIVFQLPDTMVTVFSTLGLVNGTMDSPVLQIVTSLIASVGGTIVGAIVWIALGFQYYNLVERKEGSGLRDEIEALGSGDLERTREEY